MNSILHHPNHLADALTLRPGSIGDYHTLAAHHYRASRPATINRIFTLEHHQPTVVGRYLNRQDEKQTVAVLVESMPTLRCQLRDHALPGRYGEHLSQRARAQLINNEIRCISRVIVDPRWRGLGLAVRLVRHALTTATTPYTEALAAMGRVHPFFEKAGMTPYERPPHATDTRLIAALERVNITPLDLALLDQVNARIDALDAASQTFIHRELRRWYRHTTRSSATDSSDTRDHLRLAQQRLTLNPIYYLHLNTLKG